jgi:S-adenosylmethionine synthetase
MQRIITAESVNIGHPDKTCDTIADAFLDAALGQDPNAQMAVECAIKDDLLMIYGEATTTAKINYEKIAKEILQEIGYRNEFRVIKQISEQSPDINRAVVKKGGAEANEVPTSLEQSFALCAHEAANAAVVCLAANDQGIVYGYATNETPEFMPLPIMIAHKLMRKYEEFRKTGESFFADAKSQVSIEYDGANKPKRIHTILISASHTDDLTHDEVFNAIKANVIDEVLSAYGDLADGNIKYIINPSGKFTIWGSFSDSGCVGRKIVVDSYGGAGRVGGGCFSSKNATKVDRSGAYYVRYTAKNIVANGLADRCEIQASYGIGLSQPISINIDCFGTEKKPLDKIYDFVNEHFDFSPGSIIKELDLLKPQYKQTACYGHFGRPEFSWEKVKQYNCGGQ